MAHIFSTIELLNLLTDAREELILLRSKTSTVFDPTIRPRLDNAILVTRNSARTRLERAAQMIVGASLAGLGFLVWGLNR